MAIAAKQKSFQKHKLTGVDLIGGIPSGWRVEYMKNLGRFESSGIDKKIVEGEPLVQMVNYTDIYGNESRVIDGERELMTVSCPAWKVAEANLIRGDLVFTPSSETTEDIGLSALILDDLKNTVFSYHVIRFRFSEKLDHGFKKYLCNNNLVLQQFSSVAKGTTRQILDRNDFKNIIVVIPPIELQKQIADFLDLKTAKIDEVADKKQKLIDLLKEKRQALITQAVTKGLDPKAKMKPSGIDWLGEIPDEWEVKKLKYLVKAKRGAIKTGPFGSDLTRDDYVFDQESSFAKIYTQQNIIENDLSLGDDYITKEKYLELIACTLEKDDVVLTTRGTLGRSMVFTAEAPMGIMHPCLLRVQLDERYCLKEFFQLLIQESHYFLEQLVYVSNATTIEVLYGDTLKPMQIALPSIVDQKKILEHVTQKSNRIDEMMKKVEMQTEKLQEYRQALITSVVTGKIMVN